MEQHTKAVFGDTPVVTKETKNKIRVDYEGKMTIKERIINKLKSSNTWITVVVNIFRFILMLGVSFVILQPFISKIAGSFMTKKDVIDATISLIPKNPTLMQYEAIMTENGYFEALFNTTLISLLCALIQTFVACLIGYGLAKFKFKGNGIIMGLVVFSMVIPHRTIQLSLSKHFLEFDFGSFIALDNPGIIELITGEAPMLTNSFWPLIILSICGLAFKNGLYIYLMRQFFKGVPDELEESAYVDGSGVFRTFFQIIIPLSVPMMITIFLFSFSWQWTDEFYTGTNVFFTPSADKMILFSDIYHLVPQSIQASITDPSYQIWPIVVRNTSGILIILPLVIIYLFCQKYLVQGIERSGLVG